MGEGIPKGKQSVGEASGNESPEVGGEAEKTESQRRESASLNEMNKEEWGRLMTLHDALFAGGGLHALEAMMYSGILPKEDFEAVKRVSRGIVLGLEDYKNDQHGAANRDAEEIELVKQRLADLQGSK